ncbi:MAG TPA: DUF3072 domain-containing protein [Chitinophagaceae bacterium]
MNRENKNIKSDNRNRQGDSQQNQRVSSQPDRTNTVKDPEEWTTGDEEMTGAQRSYLKTLSDEAGEEMHEDLSKADASKKIDELQQKTGRGKDH